MAHYVYRVYDAHGDLIYIGATGNLFRRLNAHAHGTWWAHQAAHVVAKVYTYDAALQEERRAIQAEQPRWNIIGVWRSHRTWDRARFIDYVTAYVNRRPALTEYGRAHLANVARLYQAKFGEYLPTDKGWAA